MKKNYFTFYGSIGIDINAVVMQQEKIVRCPPPDVRFCYH